MRLLQCYPFVVLNRLRRGNTKVGLPMKSSGILVLDLNQRKSLPSILALPSPNKYLSLLPKKNFTYLVHYCPFQESQKINAEGPNSRLSRAWQDFLLEGCYERQTEFKNYELLRVNTPFNLFGKEPGRKNIPLGIFRFYAKELTCFFIFAIQLVFHCLVFLQSLHQNLKRKTRML